MRRQIVAAAVAGLVALSTQVEAAPNRVALSSGQQVTRTGHLEGASASGFVVAPYRSDYSEQLCTPDACEEVAVTVKLPRGRVQGDLAAVVTAPMQSAGLNIKMFNAAGDLIASAEGGGFGAPASEVSSYAIARGLKAGTYTVRTYLSVGTANFTQKLTWTAGSGRSAR